MKDSKSLSVCLVSQEYPDETDYGGIATYMYYLSKALANCNNRVFVVCRSYTEDCAYQDNTIMIYRIRENDEYKYRHRVATMVAMLVKKEDIDIIESPEWGADLIEYYKQYKSELKVPVVIKLHTPYFVWKKYNRIIKSSYIPEIEEWEKEIVMKADGVFSCSNALRDIVSEEYNIDKSQIVTIPNLIETRSVITDKKSDREDIYYVGSLEQRKGVFILAEAFNIVKKQIPSARIFFVGRDTTRNEKNISTKDYIQEIIDDEESCNFIEHVPNDSVVKYMQKASVLVFPSLFENFPYVLLEAMKCQKPIIGSRNGGMKEMIDEGTSGMLYTPPNVVELANNIVEVLSDCEFAQRLGDNAKKRVSKFSIDNVIKFQKAYYMEVVESNARQK